MALFRENTLTEIDGNKQLSYVDYNFHDTGLPRSNALEFVYDNGLAFTVRPSGTEPKLKIYTFTCGISAKDAIDKNEKLSEILRSIIKNG